MDDGRWSQAIVVGHAHGAVVMRGHPHVGLHEVCKATGCMTPSNVAQITRENSLEPGPELEAGPSSKLRSHARRITSHRGPAR
eukprot:3214404-Amphidinium_carterae.5